MLLRDLTKVYISEYKEIEDHRRNRKKSGDIKEKACR